ncbi:HBS1-like protein isoform X2 [Anneissia japonica]|uniref:HBS1-like protein isoform X2 n=1 Tax=Anneissia japonica TaxID=1529436 RepID=UPI001425B850|nr:HBS1-like protein isoform X2 [Anneissia japonica]
MSRHRNVRDMDYGEEYDGYYEVYGHSVEDDCAVGVSPSTEREFMYRRSFHDNSLSSYMEKIGEGDAEDQADSDDEHPLQDSKDFSRPKLSDHDEARLNSCIDGIRNVMGDNVPEHVMIDTVLKTNFSLEKALDSILHTQTNEKQPAKKPVPNVVLQGPGAKPKNPQRTGTNVNSKASDTMLTLPLQSTPPRKNFTSPTRGVTRGFNVASDDLNSGMGKRFSVDSGKKLDISVGQRLPTVRSTPDLVSMANSTPNRRESKSGSGKLGIDIAKAFEERQAEKPLLNLVVIGHVDAGKSTLMGHLLQQLGNVNQRTMHRYEQESKKQGKASFAYAWVLDETGEERQRGITMDVGINKFETEHRIITLLDAPGHKDFIPNMITGAAQADVAVLVVDATRGEFETGFESGGQTREHAMLVRSLGVTQLVVAVNKLDTVDWSEDRFNEIVQKLSHFLKQVAGFKESDLVYVPCSGLTGENLSKRTQEKLLRQWYKERSLLECIDSFKPPKRSLDKPFRHCVSDIFKGMGSGFSVSGKIVSGSVQVGQKVVVMPAGDSGVVKSVFIHEEDMKWACAGDHATLTVTGIDQMNVTVGNIICNVDQPIAACVRFRARIITFSLEIPITKGFQVLMHYQTLSEPATVRKLVSILHKSTGEVLKQKPRCLTKHTNAIIEIDVSRPISLELYKDFKDLGRFMLRYSGSTIAAGLVVEILK